MTLSQNFKLINDDCFDVMNDLNTNSVDLIVTDPPYNVNLEYDEYDDNKDDDEYWSWVNSFLDLCENVLKDDGALYLVTPKNQLRNWINVIDESCFEELTGSPLVWCRPNHFGNKGKHWSYSSYMVFALHLGSHDVNSSEEMFFSVNSLDYIVEPAPQSNYNDRERMHPAQQPVALYKKFILKSSKKDDIVLDPFMGSGSTGVACKMYRRNYIGIDISGDYVSMAEKRISKVFEKDFENQLKIQSFNEV